MEQLFRLVESVWNFYLLGVSMIAWVVVVLCGLFWVVVKLMMAPAQIAEAQRLAREWKAKGK